MQSFSIMMTDTEGDPVPAKSGLTAAQARLFLTENPASRYSVTKWDGEEIEGQWNGLEWMELSTPATITFKRRTYTVVQELPVTPLLAAEGLTGQHVIEGANGASFLLQTYDTGSRKTISTSGRTAWEHPAA